MHIIEIQTQFGLSSLTLNTRPTPIPQKGEVLVKLKAASLNYRDLMMVRGQYNPKQHRIDQIISQHSFNCVSSAIFYAIACRSFNIKITGVATTDHVLAQLQLSDSTKIVLSIEWSTTSITSKL